MNAFRKKCRHKRLSSQIIAAGLALVCCWKSRADSASVNFPFVAVADTDGTTSRGGYYARCVPASPLGTNGLTTIYRVEKDHDVLVHTYNWYSHQIFLSGIKGKISLVRFGPWPEGQRATTNGLAVAFYYDGRFLKAYSTLDIVGTPTNVQRSVSHYTWLGQIPGYGQVVSASGDQFNGFTIKTLSGQSLTFNVATGELLSDVKPVSSVSVTTGDQVR